MDLVTNVELTVPLIHYEVGIDPKKAHREGVELPWWLPRPAKKYALPLPTALLVAIRSRSMYQTTFAVEPETDYKEKTVSKIAVVYRPPLLKITETVTAGDWSMVAVYEANV
jgi:hypothetical protein